jgi:hypothetical protein
MDPGGKVIAKGERCSSRITARECTFAIRPPISVPVGVVMCHVLAELAVSSRRS